MNIPRVLQTAMAALVLMYPPHKQCMEKFKAVEKEMKTKAFSKEGLSAAAKLDPKEQERQDMADFLTEQIDALEAQIETMETEAESLQSTMKKKKDPAKVERIAELGERTDTHKWHQQKLELILRLLQNGGVDVESIKDVEDGIKYYVENNQEVDFAEDDSLYDELNLEAEEGAFGVATDDHQSSQDSQSMSGDAPESDTGRSTSIPNNTSTITKKNEPAAAAARRPSVQLKSPLPALATLHTSTPATVNGAAPAAMKPAPIPTIPTGQPLKYASAAAAAAASDKSGVGIAPLPPPPGATMARQSSTASPATMASQPVTVQPSPQQPAPPQPAKPIEPPAKSSPAPEVVQAVEPSVKSEPVPPQIQPTQTSLPIQSEKAVSQSKPSAQQTPDSGVALTNGEVTKPEEPEEDVSVYHLPSSLNDLLESFNATKLRVDSHQPIDERMLTASRIRCPSPADAEKPYHYKPQSPYAYTPAHYPQEPLPIFNDERLYSRIDTDTLFYAFYYRQGTFQQYCAAKALKSQSWRFHKQYQTWFQRHEEPKNITEEYEQGTYRFFDYESTWLENILHLPFSILG